jgi:hypothetical protein
MQRYVQDSTRLGIPITIASDPRHAFSSSIFAMSSKGFSQWPEQLGFAAIGDEKLMQKFGDIARQEYLAVGIREALHQWQTWPPNHVGHASVELLARMHRCLPNSPKLISSVSKGAN